MSSGTETWLPRGHLLGGRYRIEAPIGAGGFGQVYRAAQLPLEREVAVKVLTGDALSRPDRRARFEREAKLAQGLSHPNTVRVLDYGISEDGAPFLVMELLRGEPLQNLLERAGGQPPEVAAIVLRDVLKSLMEAHALGIVHRDIKPANIFLTSHAGEPLVAKLLDFGVAKHFDPSPEPIRPEDFGPDAPASGSLTLRGRVMGTPRYMAPEQVAGERVGPGADLYALGLTIAETLTGRPVFDEESGMKVCLAHLAPVPVPLPAVAIASPLGPVLVRATEKDPARRFQSAAEMLRDVEAVRAATVGNAGTSAFIASSGPAPPTPIAYAPTLATGPILRASSPSAPSAATASATREATAVAIPAPLDARRRQPWRPVIALFGGLAALAVAVLLILRLGFGLGKTEPRPKTAKSASSTTAPSALASPAPSSATSSAATHAAWPYPFAPHSFDTPQPRKLLPNLFSEWKSAVVGLGYETNTESETRSAEAASFLGSFRSPTCAVTVLIHKYASDADLKRDVAQQIAPWFGAVPAFVDGLTVLVIGVNGKTVEQAQACASAIERRLTVE